MTDLTCPADGCEFVGGSEESLRGHWGGKTDDDAHSGSLQARLNDRLKASSPSDNSVSESETADGGGGPTMPEADGGGGGGPDGAGGEGDAKPWAPPCGCGRLDLQHVDPPDVIRCPECERAYEITDL